MVTSFRDISSRKSDRYSATSRDTDSVSEKLRSGVTGLADEASETASNLKDAASQNLSTVADRATGLAADTADALKSQANSLKSSGADAISGIASGVRGIADNIGEQAPAVAGVVRSAADSADSFSQQIREQDFGDLFEAAVSYTRKRPAVALGIGIVAGVLLSRLFQSGRDA